MFQNHHLQVTALILWDRLVSAVNDLPPATKHLLPYFHITDLSVGPSVHYWAPLPLCYTNRPIDLIRNLPAVRSSPWQWSLADREFQRLLPLRN